MASILADLNARTEDDRVRLKSRESIRSLEEVKPKADDWVWLVDDDIRVGARLAHDATGFVAIPAWDTVEDLRSDVTDSEAQEAATELRELMTQLPRDHRRVLDILPRVESTMSSGLGALARCQALAGLGHPELALLATEEGLAEAPDNSALAWWRLQILRELDWKRALGEASKYFEQQALPVLIIEAVSQTLLRAASEGTDQERIRCFESILDVTARLRSAPDRNQPRRAAPASIHTLRGFALLQTDRYVEAAQEFGTALQLVPDQTEVLVLRGIATYPSHNAILDFERTSTQPGGAGYVPSFYLAHHYATAQMWAEARAFANKSLQFRPPNRPRAALLNWLAIADIEEADDLIKAQQRFGEALKLAPDDASLTANSRLLETLIARRPRRIRQWRIEEPRDVKADIARALGARLERGRLLEAA